MNDSSTDSDSELILSLWNAESTFKVLLLHYRQFWAVFCLSSSVINFMAECCGSELWHQSLNELFAWKDH